MFEVIVNEWIVCCIMEIHRTAKKIVRSKYADWEMQLQVPSVIGRRIMRLEYE